MTAATKDFPSPKLGAEDIPPPTYLAIPAEANVQIYGGSIAASDSSGNAVPPTSSSALLTWGRVERQVNNLTTNAPFGAAGAQQVQVRPGAYYFFNDGSITAAMIGQPCFALDDETVTSNPTPAGASYWLPFAGIVEPPGSGIAGTTLPTNTKVPVYVGAPSCTCIVLHAVIDVPLATITAGTSNTPFNIGPALPANARLLDAQINVITALSGGGASAVTASLAASADSTFATNPKATIVAATTVFTGAFTPINVLGSNPYPNRGGQQLQMNIVVTAGTQGGLTAGHLSVDVFYTIVQ